MAISIDDLNLAFGWDQNLDGGRAKRLKTGAISFRDERLPRHAEFFALPLLRSSRRWLLAASDELSAQRIETR